MLRSRQKVASASQGNVDNSNGTSPLQKQRTRKTKTGKRNSSNRTDGSSSGSCILIGFIFFVLVICVYVIMTPSSTSGAKQIIEPDEHKTHVGLRKSSMSDQIRQQASNSNNDMSDHKDFDSPNSIYNLQYLSIDGDFISFRDFKGHVALVINVASE